MLQNINSIDHFLKKMKKVIELMKEILGGKISTKIFKLRAKTYSFLIDDGNEDKKKKQNTQKSMS